MSTVYVLVEHADGQVLPATGELVTAARVLGDVTAVVVGTPGVHEPLVPKLAELGAASIIAAQAADVDSRIAIPQADALSMLAAATPGPILLDAGVHGNEIAGRLAARLASGVLCDVVGINPDRTAHLSVFGDTFDVSAAVGEPALFIRCVPEAWRPCRLLQREPYPSWRYLQQLRKT